MKLIIILVFLGISLKSFCQAAPIELACKLDLVFCVDNSKSIGENDYMNPNNKNWLLTKKFVRYFAQKAHVGKDTARIGMVDFGFEGYIDWDLSKYTDEDALVEAIDNMQYRAEYTNTSGGIHQAYRLLMDPEFGGRENVAKLLVLITDGMPNLDPETLMNEVGAVKAANIRIIAIGITEDVAEDLLLHMASSNDDFVHAITFEDLEKIDIARGEKCEITVEQQKPRHSTGTPSTTLEATIATDVTITPEPTTTEATTELSTTETTTTPEPTTTETTTTSEPTTTEATTTPEPTTTETTTPEPTTTETTTTPEPTTTETTTTPEPTTTETTTTPEPTTTETTTTPEPTTTETTTTPEPTTTETTTTPEPTTTETTTTPEPTTTETTTTPEPTTTETTTTPEPTTTETTTPEPTTSETTPEPTTTETTATPEPTTTETTTTHEPTTTEAPKSSQEATTTEPAVPSVRRTIHVGLPPTTKPRPTTTDEDGCVEGQD